MDKDDVHSLALCCWKEARGEGDNGMCAVMHVIMNRVGFPGFAHTVHDCVYGKNQFTSMSVPSDPEFNLEPHPDDPQFSYCMTLAGLIQMDDDLTKGAHYYANLAHIDKGGWFQRVILTDAVKHPHLATIGKQEFFK